MASSSPGTPAAVFRRAGKFAGQADGGFQIRGRFEHAFDLDLVYMGFPAAHRVKLHSTNPLERLNGEIKRRTEVVDIFPNESAIRRLVGAILLEQNDEWSVQRSRYMTRETISEMVDTPVLVLPAAAA